MSMNLLFRMNNEYATPQLLGRDGHFLDEIVAFLILGRVGNSITKDEFLGRNGHRSTHRAK